MKLYKNQACPELIQQVVSLQEAGALIERDSSGIYIGSELRLDPVGDSVFFKYNGQKIDYFIK